MINSIKTYQNGWTNRDFSKDKLEDAEVLMQFENDNLEAALDQIVEYMVLNQGE